MFADRRHKERRERGALAPRGFATATAPALVSSLSAVSRDFAKAPCPVRFPEPRRADEHRSRRKRTPLQLRYSHPRRANARRSLLMYVRTSKKLFFSPASVRTRKTRAGGVSPPWFRYRDCTGVRQLTAGSLPRLCQRALSSPLPRTTASGRTPLSTKTYSVAITILTPTAG
jgi:hypothetical protein